MINVKYQWNGSPVKDYTVSVYSAMENIVITNSRNEENILYADGRQPSQFKNSNFKGFIKCGSKHKT